MMLKSRETISALYGPQSKKYAKGEIGSIRWDYEHRSADGAGRFGGGWQWKLGFQSGNLNRKRGHIIFNLLVSTLSISWGK